MRRKGTGQVYAMKVMRKERILARDHMDYVRAEREVLTAVFHPYIVTLRCSFQVSSCCHETRHYTLALWPRNHQLSCSKPRTDS